MNKEQLRKLKRDLLCAGLIGITLTTSGCVHEDKVIPPRAAITSRTNNADDCYKYIIKDGEALRVYDSSKVYILYDKENYNISEYLVNKRPYSAEVYELVSEEMIFYYSGLSNANAEYYTYLINNNYEVCLADIEDYIEGSILKDFYTLEEIRELEPKILEGLKKINAAKQKTLNKE